MKIYRSGYTSNDWSFTDEKKPAVYRSSWEPGNKIFFDGTIDKSGERHTAIGVQIDENDVAALMNKLISNYKSTIKELNKRVKKLEENEDRLLVAFSKIYYLTSSQKDSAPTETELIEAIHIITEYYYRYDGNKPPRPKWLKWNSL